MSLWLTLDVTQTWGSLLDHLEGYGDDNRIATAIEPLPEGVSGYYRRHGDLVVLSSSTSVGEWASTLAHELAHREDPRGVVEVAWSAVVEGDVFGGG